MASSCYLATEAKKKVYFEMFVVGFMATPELGPAVCEIIIIIKINNFNDGKKPNLG